MVCKRYSRPLQLDTDGAIPSMVVMNGSNRHHTLAPHYELFIAILMWPIIETGRATLISIIHGKSAYRKPHSKFRLLKPFHLYGSREKVTSTVTAPRSHGESSTCCGTSLKRSIIIQCISTPRSSISTRVVRAQGHDRQKSGFVVI